MKTRNIGIRVATVFVALVPLASQSRTPEDLARAQLENGRGLLGRGNYEQALHEFRAVTAQYPETGSAADAHLEMGRYYLVVADDPEAASKEADEILAKYARSNAAPPAYLLKGQVIVSRTRRRIDLENAVATFDRMVTLYPRAASVPLARYLAAEALRLARDPGQALKRYREIVTSWPHDAVIPKVHLGTGMALAQSDDPLGAMQELQFARSEEASDDDASLALARLSILHRLFVKPAEVSAFTYTPRENGLPSRAQDVTNVIITPRGTGYFASKSGVFPFDAAAAAGLPALTRTRGLAVDRAGQLTVIDNGILKRKNAAPLTLMMTRAMPPKLLEQTIAAVCLRNGDWIVTANDDYGIQRFAPNGSHLGTFAPRRAARLAVNEFDEVAALDRDLKSVTILDESGRAAALIGARGPDFEFKNPVDVAYDGFGHLYVLDHASVFVFSTNRAMPRLLRTFSEAETSVGVFRRASAFALDRAGRLFVADERVDKIRLYQ
jgi:tetratricopeptide (TPR) repeat protein